MHESNKLSIFVNQPAWVRTPFVMEAKRSEGLTFGAISCAGDGSGCRIRRLRYIGMPTFVPTSVALRAFRECMLCALSSVAWSERSGDGTASS